jgi:hypothetical protein
MEYKRIVLFGRAKSRGTFDDFFSTEKYKNLQEAYDAGDYVECDFVKDENGVLHIEARNVKNPDEKKYHQLIYQNCPFGLDVLDDNMGIQLATSLF